MPTQVAHFELRSPADTIIRFRDDVHTALVLVTDDARPVRLARFARPPNGVLTHNDIRDGGGAEVVSESPSVKEGQRPAAERRVDAPPVTVIVPTRERPDDLARCLESLSAVDDHAREVIVVDSGPTTSRTAAVAARFGVRHVVERLPGLNRARNAGVAAAAHDIVAFVDDDVVVSRQWLAAMRACFVDAAVGCATGLVLPLELETTGQEEFELYSQNRRDLQRHVYSRSVLRPSAAGLVGMGANMAFRRDLLLSLGNFDLRLGPVACTRAGDETDMFARVLDSGRVIVYSPDAYVWHRHRRTVREVRSCVFGYGVGVYSVLTKRLLEQRDLGALVTAGRWLVGPVVKAARAKILGRPAPAWRVVLAETAGAALGPFCFGYEAWRGRAGDSSTPGSAGTPAGLVGSGRVESSGM
jgi:GT2 family glycosyltransferase